MFVPLHNMKPSNEDPYEGGCSYSENNGSLIGVDGSPTGAAIFGFNLDSKTKLGNSAERNRLLTKGFNIIWPTEMLFPSGFRWLSSLGERGHILQELINDVNREWKQPTDKGKDNLSKGDDQGLHDNHGKEAPVWGDYDSVQPATILEVGYSWDPSLTFQDLLDAIHETAEEAGWQISRSEATSVADEIIDYLQEGEGVVVWADEENMKIEYDEYDLESVQHNVMDGVYFADGYGTTRFTKQFEYNAFEYEPYLGTTSPTLEDMGLATSGSSEDKKGLLAKIISALRDLFEDEDEDEDAHGDHNPLNLTGDPCESQICPAGIIAETEWRMPIVVLIAQYLNLKYY